MFYYSFKPHKWQMENVHVIIRISKQFLSNKLSHSPHTCLSQKLANATGIVVFKYLHGRPRIFGYQRMYAPRDTTLQLL